MNAVHVLEDGSLVRAVTYFHQRAILCCDADCAHAWGMNWRGQKGATAPANPGTYEGDQAKPIKPSERLNKWCARECERSKMVFVDHFDIVQT